MERRRSLLMAGGTVLVALGAAQYLQTGSAESAAALATVPHAGSTASDNSATGLAPTPPAALAVSARSGAAVAMGGSHAASAPAMTGMTQATAPAHSLLAQAPVGAMSGKPTLDLPGTDPLTLASGSTAVKQSTAETSSNPAIADSAIVSRDSLAPSTLLPTGPDSLTLARATGAESAAADPTSAAFTGPDTSPQMPQHDRAASEDCPVLLDLFADGNAMLALTLTAPCLPNAGVVLGHAGMAVTYQTTATGSLFLDLPALDAKGEVSIRFPDGTEVVAAAPVPELATLRRFAIQWTDGDSFALATDAPVTTLGTTATVLPMFAQIVTLPSDATPLSIEAEVTDLTCGREALGAAFYSEGGKVRTSDLAVALPDCDGEGGYVVLNNPVADMKLAAAE